MIHIEFSGSTQEVLAEMSEFLGSVLGGCCQEGVKPECCEVEEAVSTEVISEETSTEGTAVVETAPETPAKTKEDKVLELRKILLGVVDKKVMTPSNIVQWLKDNYSVSTAADVAEDQLDDAIEGAKTLAI